MAALFGGGRRRPISRSGEFWGRCGGNTGGKGRAAWSAVNTAADGVKREEPRRTRGGEKEGRGGGSEKKREGHGRAARGSPVSAEDVDKRGSHCPRRGGGHVATLAIPKRRLVPARRLVYIKLRG